MKTISADTAKFWINSLNNISDFLTKAESSAGLEPEQWADLWEAKARANFMRDELLGLIVADVAIETDAA